ncbi:MAG: hypothetical protein P4M11_00935 [Candidatus Pacebacteria bacterium]|nr:hypothetical protein [Candidatus Paceibacterota bacterium]
MQWRVLGGSLHLGVERLDDRLVKGGAGGETFGERANGLGVDDLLQKRFQHHQVVRYRRQPRYPSQVCHEAVEVADNLAGIGEENKLTPCEQMLKASLPATEKDRA